MTTDNDNLVPSGGHRVPREAVAAADAIIADLKGRKDMASRSVDVRDVFARIIAKTTCQCSEDDCDEMRATNCEGAYERTLEIERAQHQRDTVPPVVWLAYSWVDEDGRPHTVPVRSCVVPPRGASVRLEYSEGFVDLEIFDQRWHCSTRDGSHSATMRVILECRALVGSCSQFCAVTASNALLPEKKLDVKELAEALLPLRNDIVEGAETDTEWEAVAKAMGWLE